MGWLQNLPQRHCGGNQLRWLQHINCTSSDMCSLSLHQILIGIVIHFIQKLMTVGDADPEICWWIDFVSWWIWWLTAFEAIRRDIIYVSEGRKLVLTHKSEMQYFVELNVLHNRGSIQRVIMRPIRKGNKRTNSFMATWVFKWHVFRILAYHKTCNKP